MTAKRIQLLLLDANVVLKLHQLDLLGKVIETCDITLMQTIVQESQFVDIDGDRKYLDLQPWITTGRIKVRSVALVDVQTFVTRFKQNYLEKLDPGEAEALAYLTTSQNEHLISSADSIVWRVLGALGRREQGISLEEILVRTGLSTPLQPLYTKSFREKWTDQGFQDNLQGSVLR